MKPNFGGRRALLMNYRAMGSLLLLSLFTGNYAFIYEIKVLRKWDANRQKYHYFIGLSDFHDKNNHSGSSQLNKLEQLLAGLDKKNNKIVVEDLSSQNAQGRKQCGHFFINSRGGILGGLTDKTKGMGLDVDNIEFRYCRVSSLGPVLNNLGGNLEDCPSAMQVKISALIDEITHEIQEINRYSDGYALNKIYDTSVKEVIKAIKLLRLDEAQNLTVAQYLARHSHNQNRLELLKKLLTFDSCLLDIKIAHAAMQANNKDRMIAIAGGAHIARVCELLTTQGYTATDSTKITFAREHDLQKCLGSHVVEGAFCVKPEPIDLSLFEKALKLP
jgi:hypothetical protein